ncbi:MAG TPA: MFS transporter [Actinomycetes bacterium]|nr:MFS transporter [Actinomycetes bacterium]
MSYAGDFRAVLRHRDFRRLFATRLTSQAADGAFQSALASVFFFSPERQTSAANVAGAFAVLLLPYSLVGPFAGVLLDRWRRRQILVVANLLRTAMVLGVALLTALHVVGVPLYVAVLACLSVNRFFLAGLSAALPHVVSRAELVMANSVSTTTGTIVAILGAGAGFGLKKLLGEGDGSDAQVIVVAALAYALAALLAARMDRDLLGPDFAADRPQAREAVRHVARGLVDGARHVWWHRAAGQALAAIGAHRFFYGISTISGILLFRSYFNDPDDVDAGLAGLAGAFAASGVGFLLAAVATPEVTRHWRKQTWIVACFAGAAVTESFFVVWLSEAGLLLGAFVVGVAAQGSKICVDTIVQESVDDAFRGRVFSFYDVIFNIAFVSAAVFSALVLPADGASPAVFAVIAVGYAVTAATYGLATRRLDDRTTARPLPTTP